MPHDVSLKPPKQLLEARIIERAYRAGENERASWKSGGPTVRP